MNPSKIDIDRNVSKLRVNSAEFLNLEKSTLISMLEETIENITGINLKIVLAECMDIMVTF